MSFVSNVLDWLQALPQPALVAGNGLVAFGEAIIGVGFFLPGEAAQLLAAASVNSVPEFLILWAVATVCSVAGNTVGFVIGRRVGPALRETKLIRKHGGEGWDKATSLLRKHGTWAVFIGRLIPLVRSFVPAVAGGAGMSYRMFLPAVAAGAAASTAVTLLVGVAIAAGLKSANDVLLIVILGLLLALVATFVIRKRRKQAKAKNAAAGQDPDPELEAAR
ncbi:LPXTG-motif cell wall-anchored protein [Kibdelosporangium banguiense]|uniref:LPXTG-motif cell wall-anchored protein n=1 Tax=Kibdelosporangium banguiense TaxID=1365924 RepID=A0ABS4TY91_9PSEU|nr:DedA family protein [Kibdelosporangium banguiense]MBP2329367.1 LPXTG-motif cell wall-anchored protein [Kibdelosporangium banguiense]